MRPWIVVALSVAACLLPIAAQSAPSVAVVGIGTATTNYYGGFDAGKALESLLTDRLASLGTISVVEREHVERVFDEQRYAQSGNFSTQDAVRLGQMVGANYLIVGRVIHMDHIATNSGAAGALFSRVPFNLGGLVASGEKVHAQVALRMIDTSTGRIVKTFGFDRTQSGLSFAIADIGTNTEIYSSRQFTQSTVGVLLRAASDELAKQIGATDLAPHLASSAIEAMVIALDGSNIILNKGTADGITAGAFLSTLHQVVANDPASGRRLTTDVPDGQIQITSAGPHSSVARRISGSPAVRSIARTI